MDSHSTDRAVAASSPVSSTPGSRPGMGNFLGLLTMGSPGTTLQGLDAAAAVAVENIRGAASLAHRHCRESLTKAFRSRCRLWSHSGELRG